MAGQVDERTKKARAAELLALAAEARAAFARRGLGTVTRVLAETRLPDGRWVGHAEDHVLAAVDAATGDPADLENAIVTVRRTAIDGEAADRVDRRDPGDRPAAPRAATHAARDAPRRPPMPADCLFCRIAAGEIPATKVHEDDLVLAIRDINPQAPTHVLVLPRRAHRLGRRPDRGRRPAARAPVRGRRADRARRGPRRRLAPRHQRRAATAASRSTTSTSTCSAAGR